MPGQQPPIPSFSVGEILTARKLTQLGNGVRANNERLGFRRDVRASQVVVFARITGGGADGGYEAEQVTTSGETIAEADGGLRWGFGELPALTELNRRTNVPFDLFVRVYPATTSWVFLEPSPFPPGGLRHMPLTKASDDDGDVHWDWLRAHE